MTPRERTLCALRRERADAVPWNGDLDYWMTYLRAENKLPERYGGEAGRFRLHKDLGVGFYLQGYFPFQTVYDGVRVTSERTGDSTRTTFALPGQTLTETSRWVRSTYSTAPTEYLLKSSRDFAVLREVYARTRYLPDYGLCERMADYVGDQGVRLVYTPHTPFMELCVALMGIENLVYAIDDDEDGFMALYETMCERFDEAAELALASPAECIMIPENLSAEVVGKRNYERYIAPLHRKWTARIREAGKFSFIHMDGTLRALIREVAASGFDVLEALTPAPVGDMTLAEMMEAVGPNTIVWGGLPGGYFTDMIDDAAFETFVIDTLKVMHTNPRFVLGVSDQVCPGARFERIASVKRLAETYGRYD